MIVKLYSINHAKANTWKYMIDRYFKPTISNSEFMTEDELFKWYTRSNIISLYGSIIEDFIANGVSIDKLSKKHNLNYDKICEVISFYYNKPQFELTLLSRV